MPSEQGDVRVLVVDDDPVVATLHSRMVQSWQGFDVVGTSAGVRQATRAVGALRPDLLLLDVYMPDGSGLDMLKSLRARGNDVDVIVITAAPDLATVKAAMAGGVFAYLVKPFTMSVLHERLTEYLDRRKAIVAAARSSRLVQDHVDRIVAPSTGASGPLPKGLSRASLALVISAVQDSEQPIGAADVGTAVGMSRVAARRYLEHLVARGDAAVTPRYGGSGRPENLYSWVAQSGPDA